MASTNAEHGRPLGVSVIAVVVMAFGAVVAVLGLARMLLGFVSGIMDAPRGAGLEFLAGLGGLILGGAYILAGFGLWRMRAWAWWLAVLAGVVGFVLALGSPVWMLVWGALVVYLLLVRANFGVLKGKPLTATV